MPIVHHTSGPGLRLTEVLGADAELRSQLAGDIHLVSLDGKYFYPFPRRPEPGDYEAIEAVLADEENRLMEYSRGIVARAYGTIEEVEV